MPTSSGSSEQINRWGVRVASVLWVIFGAIGLALGGVVLLVPIAMLLDESAAENIFVAVIFVLLQFAVFGVFWKFVRPYAKQNAMFIQQARERQRERLRREGPDTSDNPNAH